jgi:hypothetical protein
MAAGHQDLDVAPAQFSPRCGEKCLVSKNLRDAETMPQLLLAPAFAVISGQLLRQRGDNLFAIFGALTLQHLGPDTTADLPVQQGKLRINAIATL